MKQLFFIIIAVFITVINGCGNIEWFPAQTQEFPADISTSITGSATAVCMDNWTSHSQNCSGTCSHHGGVKQWLTSACGGTTK